MNRRTFLYGALALQARAAQPFRSISYNVLACGGYPKTPANVWRFQAGQPQLPSRYALDLGLSGRTC